MPPFLAHAMNEPRLRRRRLDTNGYSCGYDGGGYDGGGYGGYGAYDCGGEPSPSPPAPPTPPAPPAPPPAPPSPPSLPPSAPPLPARPHWDYLPHGQTFPLLPVFNSTTSQPVLAPPACTPASSAGCVRHPRMRQSTPRADFDPRAAPDCTQSGRVGCLATQPPIPSVGLMQQTAPMRFSSPLTPVQSGLRYTDSSYTGTYSMPMNHLGMKAVDITGDGHLDLLSGGRAIFVNDGGGGFSTLLPLGDISGNCYSCGGGEDGVAGDFDGDGGVLVHVICAFTSPCPECFTSRPLTPCASHLACTMHFCVCIR